ncbi:MAG: hypothetical protein GX790_09455, partial [Syntrophomonadaceae bacterium]|nr:hypothetical protein [Syntrophomonadaceae bacterium]
LGYEGLKINGKQVQLVNLADNTKEDWEFDRIVCAVGYHQNDTIDISEVDSVKKTYVVGDNRNPRDIMQALYEGMMVAYDLADSFIK